MPLHPVYGHQLLRERLGAAIHLGRFPSSSLISGPVGVGKQRLALWIGSTLLCEQAGPSPCGTCHSCHQIDGLGHPDLHWFIPFPPSKRKASDPEKQVLEAGDTIADIVAERREKPLYAPLEPTASHPIASTRLLQRRVAMRPFQGSRKVVILGNAERLIVQEASQEAANALLKILEEPPEGTYLILTTPVPQRLLPTIRSRLTPVRVPPVSDAAALQFATEQLGMSDRDAQKQVDGSGGSIGNLVGHRNGKSGTNDAPDRLLKAAKGGASQWSALALTQPPWGARADFTEMLDAAALRLRRQMTQSPATDPARMTRPLRAIEIIHEFREGAQRNVNPQLGMALLAQRLSQI